jgi:predicted MFS family arabinose efflux permease
MHGLRRWLVMAVLSVSGGVIYLLPFLQEVYYKPLMQALHLDNTQVGGLMSAFGLTSMLAYFPGGWLADRVSPRKLLAVSLLATGAAGLYFATFPPYVVSLAIHAFWGISITLLFWSAMIRVTRGWAPPEQQGRAFGILETGRGIGEVLSSVALLAVFGWLGSGDRALSTVVTLFSCLILLLGLLCWLVLEDNDGHARESERVRVGPREIVQVLRMPVVWLIALVILCGYCAYWGTFRFTPYATDMFGLSVTLAAAISVAKMWLKPVAALIAGFVSDRLGIANSVAWLFAVIGASFLLFAFLPGSQTFLPLMLANVALASLAIFAMRGIYFALLEEGRVPMAVTGTAAGLISVISYTPDIFMPLLGGILIDRDPGAAGYRSFFLCVAGICSVGLTAALAIRKQAAGAGSADSQPIV